MGLIASGAFQPNITGVTGSLQDAGTALVGVTSAIYALVDCRNASGLTFSEESLLPTESLVTGGSVYLEFAFYKTNQIPFSLDGISIRNLADVTSYPINTGAGLTTSPDLVQRLRYAYTGGGKFLDIVPVLGPWCVISITVSGLNTMSLSGNASNSNNGFVPLLLGNTRSQYDGSNKGSMVLNHTTYNVPTGVITSFTINTITSGEMFLSGFSGSSAATQQLRIRSVYMNGTTVVNNYIDNLPGASWAAAGILEQRGFVLPRGYLIFEFFQTAAANVAYSLALTKGSF